MPLLFFFNLGASCKILEIFLRFLRPVLQPLAESSALCETSGVIVQPFQPTCMHAQAHTHTPVLDTNKDRGTPTQIIRRSTGQDRTKQLSAPPSPPFRLPALQVPVFPSPVAQDCSPLFSITLCLALSMSMVLCGQPTNRTRNKSTES